jgi:dTDP-4-dehydrorhamnose reductase
MKVLVLGASGLLGNAVFRLLRENRRLKVVGTIRSPELLHFFGPKYSADLLLTPNLSREESLEAIFVRVQPELVINCVSVALAASGLLDRQKMIEVFALLPHRLARICGQTGARLVQISSDGVFSGCKGSYTEDDVPDARDTYGISKLLGEIGEPHITLRTSIIGHEITRPHGLLEWFLRQGESCRCYTKAIFSGFPTVVLAQLIRDIIIPMPALSGVYHVASSSISKFDLLSLVAEVYGKKITIIPDDRVSIDRSLVAMRFNTMTGYVPPAWPELVKTMYLDQQEWEGWVLRSSLPDTRR